MNTALSPIESEFSTTEQAEAYKCWLRAKVQESLDDPRPNIPHDVVMAEMRKLLEDQRKDQDAGRVAA
ncbi:MAG: antitoxin [Betaproteobacteria bacterium]|nr:antitoxin [Betaproteobacteria bacterium]